MRRILPDRPLTNAERAARYRQRHPDRVKATVESHRQYYRDTAKEYRGRRRDYYKDRQAHRVVFGDERHIQHVKPRTGKCSNCGREVGDEIKLTYMHHILYDVTDPLNYTKELCMSCHRKGHVESHYKAPDTKLLGSIVRAMANSF